MRKQESHVDHDDENDMSAVTHLGPTRFVTLTNKSVCCRVKRETLNALHIGSVI